MATPYHVLGTAIVVPAGGLTLAWTATITDGTTTTTLTTADAADPVLTAGTYDPITFCAHVASKIRASLYARLVADAWVTSKPAAATDLTVQVAPGTVTPGVGTTTIEITVDLNNIPGTGVGPASISVFSLVNTSNNWCYLGLAYPGETRSLAITTGTVRNVAGRFQPRWLFAFRSTFRDSGDIIKHLDRYAYPLSDGSVSQYEFGAGPHWERDLVLVDLPQHIAGPPWVVGRFSAFGATRELLALQTISEVALTGLSGTYKRTDNLTSPVYLAAGKWWARYREQSPTDTYKMMDVWPSTRTPAVGEPIQAISEVDALVREVRRTGLLFRFDPNDATGSTTWISKAYALRSGANPEPIRRASGNLYYSVELPLVLVHNPGLATV